MTGYDKQLEKLFRAVAELLVKKAREGMPETGAFRKIAVSGECKGSDFQSNLSVEPSGSEEAQRYVSLGVHRRDSDRLVSNYLLKGTNQEIFQWLESPQGIAQMVETCLHLEQKVKNLD